MCIALRRSQRDMMASRKRGTSWICTACSILSSAQSSSASTSGHGYEGKCTWSPNHPLNPPPPQASRGSAGVAQHALSSQPAGLKKKKRLCANLHTPFPTLAVQQGVCRGGGGGLLSVNDAPPPPPHPPNQLWP